MMKRAIELAEEAASHDEVPVGAVVYDDEGRIYGEGYNLTHTTCDPTAHAEMVALRAAGKAMQSHYLHTLNLAVTIEPCAMCAQAMSWARIKQVVYGAEDVKSGGTDNGVKVFRSPNCHHKPQVMSGVDADACKALMQNFFKAKRLQKKKQPDNKPHK